MTWSQDMNIRDEVLNVVKCAIHSHIPVKTGFAVKTSFAVKIMCFWADFCVCAGVFY